MSKKNELVRLRPQLLRFAMLILRHKIVDSMRASGRYETDMAQDTPLPGSEAEAGFLRELAANAV